MRFYLIYNPHVVHEMPIEEIVRVCCDVGHSPIDPAWLVPKYNVEQWSDVQIEKIQMAAMEQCDGVIMCDNSEWSEDWLRYAKRLRLTFYDIWNVKNWQKKIDE